MTLEVLLYGSNIAARAEADDPEALMIAARTLWDEVTRAGSRGTSRRLSALFLVDGVFSCASEGRRP